MKVANQSKEYDVKVSAEVEFAKNSIINNEISIP